MICERVDETPWWNWLFAYENNQIRYVSLNMKNDIKRFGKKKCKRNVFFYSEIQNITTLQNIYCSFELTIISGFFDE